MCKAHGRDVLCFSKNRHSESQAHKNVGCGSAEDYKQQDTNI